MDDAPAPDTLLSQSLAVLRQCVPTLETAAARELKPRIMPAAQHLISYHIVTRGACWGGLSGETPLSLEAGDVLVLPRGDPYVMSSARDLRGGPADGDPAGIAAQCRQWKHLEPHRRGHHDASEPEPTRA